MSCTFESLPVHRVARLYFDSFNTYCSLCYRVWIRPPHLSSVCSLLPRRPQPIVVWGLWDRHHHLHEGAESWHLLPVILYSLFLGLEVGIHMGGKRVLQYNMMASSVSVITPCSHSVWLIIQENFWPRIWDHGSKLRTLYSCLLFSG
jgi:hypothetical protein